MLLVTNKYSGVNQELSMVKMSMQMQLDLTDVQIRYSKKADAESHVEPMPVELLTQIIQRSTSEN